MTDAARFAALITERFPQLEKEFESEDLYSRTRAFADFANRASKIGDWPTLEQCYELINSVLSEAADKDVYNAIYVSFIEHLYFHTDREKGARAKRLLPLRLRQAWDELEEYWRKNAPGKRD